MQPNITGLADARLIAVTMLSNYNSSPQRQCGHIQHLGSQNTDQRPQAKCLDPQRQMSWSTLPRQWRECRTSLATSAPSCRPYCLGALPPPLTASLMTFASCASCGSLLGTLAYCKQPDTHFIHSLQIQPLFVNVRPHSADLCGRQGHTTLHHPLRKPYCIR